MIVWAYRLLAGLAIVVLLAAAPNPLSRQSDDPIEDRIVLDDPQRVETTDERICIHTRVTDEVQEGKLLKTFEMVRELGAATVIEYLPWAYVERQRGEYDWSHPDRIIKHIEYQGLRPIIRLGFIPDWLREEYGGERVNGNYMTPEGMDYFAEFVGAFVARYAGRVDAIIIWNEPNLNIEWTATGADPIAYTELLRKTYPVAKAANPNVMVLGGALAPTNEPPRGAGGWNDIDFLNEMYLAGASDYFDALAAHIYGFTMPPQAEPGVDQLNFRRVEMLREVMVSHGDGDKDIYITEGGWNDHPRWINGVRPAQRIAYTLDAYRYLADNLPYVQAFCLWAFRYPAPTNHYPDYFTLVSTQFDPKPIYDVLQAYARGWEIPEWLPQ